METLSTDTDYKTFLLAVKQRYRSAQLKAVYTIKQELISFYWELGKKILEKQETALWGSKFLDQLSQDLQRELPGTQGFSVRNLKFMRQFAQVYPDLEIGKQPVSQLPWGHIIVLIQKVENSKTREWYANNALKNGISRSILTMQIEQDLYSRQGKQEHKITNFRETLPAFQSDLAIEVPELKKVG